MNRMKVWLEDGWLRVGPYTGSPLRTIHLGTGERGAVVWSPAFRTQTRLGRVLQVRPPQTTARSLKVWLRVDNAAEMVGQIRL